MKLWEFALGRLEPCPERVVTMESEDPGKSANRSSRFPRLPIFGWSGAWRAAGLGGSPLPRRFDRQIFQRQDFRQCSGLPPPRQNHPDQLRVNPQDLNKSDGIAPLTATRSHIRPPRFPMQDPRFHRRHCRGLGRAKYPGRFIQFARDLFR